MTRRSLLASLMALSLLCGGLGVASAEVDVKVDVSSAPGAVEVYTKTGVDTLLNDKADKTALGTKANATEVAKNTENIATNTANINQLNGKLNDLTTTVSGKADVANVYTRMEADAKLDLKANATSVFTKDEVNTKLTDYAKSDDVYTITAADGKFATSEALNTAKTDLEGKITSAKNELDGKITANTQKIGANETAITDLKDADVRLEGKINQNTNDITGLKDKDVELSGKIDNNKNLIDQNAANITQNKNDIAAIGGRLTTAEGNIQTNADAINALDTKVGTINNGNYLDGTKSVGENLNALDAQTKTNTDEIARVNQELVNTNNHFNTELGKTNTALNKEVQERVDADTKLTGRIDATDKRTAGIKRTDTGVEEDNQTVIEGKVHFDQNGNVSDVKDLSAETITTTGDAAIGGALGVTGATTLDGALMANGEATFKDKVSVEKDLTVNGKLNVGEIYLKNDKLESTGKKHDSATSITADGISNLAKVTELGHTTESQFTHNEKGTFNHAKDGNTTDWKEATSNVTADGVENIAKDSKGNNNTFTQTSTDTKNTLTDKEGNTSTTRQDSKGIYGYAKDKDGNKSYTKQEGNRIAESVIGQDGKQTKSEMTSTDITNTAKDGTITSDAKDIVNKATGNISNSSATMDTTVTGKATESYGELETEVKGNEMHTVKGDQTNEVDGKQINTIKNGQENIISGGQTNTITGGQINNITGDQTTTITGNKTETVTENVTEDYKKNLTTTVGGNENHEVKGTKTETVEGKVTENYKAGQATNVTGDQDIKVSGTQTTTATDINRNASSGMIDTIDNDYGTNTETKVAGKTTTDVSIKGTEEEGKYIRGANESRDYLIKGTLKNSETKTAEATSTEITDGNGKTSATIQDKTQISGSVTNGTSSAVSNVKADSIDTAVKEGTNTSLISQKKDSITSAVGNGTTSTVIQQGDKDITIASNGGTVGIVGKDIINNATDEITNTAGTKITDKVGNNTRVIDQTSITDTVGTASRKIEDGKITDTAGDSTVTTENGKGTTFAKTGSTEFSTEAGAPTDTNIAGNHITTGRVDANELGVSDKDGANTADLSVKAGEGVKASAGNGTTTGSLDVKADEVVSSVKDASGKGSTFKQRIDKIMMESKDVSIKAEETLTNEAKVITNKASEVINNEAVNINNTATGIIKSKASEIQNQADKLISNKVGENTWENMENGKITTSIKDGAKQNLTQSDAAGTTQSTVDGGKSTVTIQNADGLADAVTDGTNTSVQNQTASAIAAAVKDGAGNENASVANATTSVNTIKSGSKANTVISTADGTSFINSEAAAPVTGASGAGTHLNTTIKGNTITTGKVTMDYAEVMKDLGVRGNANITGKTTTGSLEVKGESKLTGDVTMESNATVKKDLTVEGNTNLKNTKVDGTLDVTQKANFGDSVSIAKDLSVGGNATIKGDVTASSYKVGDKTYISAAGINANDQKITNVADGSISEGSKDAVNGGQLYGVKNDLEGKVNKVGANAAAMANLHPMEFDPDSKWNIAAAIGNYGSETAAALGAFYRPNDDVMVNLSTAFGTGENMVGGGVSVRLGKGGNKLSREETNALKAQVADLTARMDALLSVLNPNMSKDFPDVPENHWAYEAVSRLAGNDIVQGYPDGEFHGERTMTRYEMAEIIYNALSRGAEAEKELVEEFKPELQAMAASEKATAEKAEG